MPARLDALTAWLREVLCETTGSVSQPVAFMIEPASADASFRRYFRITGAGLANCFDGAGDSLIVMDAPPDKEDSHPFVAIAEMLSTCGLNVPRVFAKDFAQGFLLLGDLGAQAYLDVLNEKTVDSLYADALAALLQMQADVSRNAAQLPAYDAPLLHTEMALFRDWYCLRHRQHSFSTTQLAELEQVFQCLSESALAQPQVFVHRDYHSRNLMFVDSSNARKNPGILDFQDAVFGPVTYDLVSLLRDCYIEWPRSRVEQWALDYLHRAADAGVIPRESDATWLRWFDWMGVQRHLKASGIFARLHLRDNKPAYLGDIPRTLNYVREVSARYPELHSLRRLLVELDF